MGNVTGEVFFKIQEDYFPENNWNDFIITIIGNWVYAYLEFLKNNSKFEFNFMDGPFMLTGILRNNNSVEINYVKRNYSQNIIIYTEIVKKSEIGLLLIKACRKTLKIMSKLGMVNSSHYSNMKKMFYQLKLVINK